MNNRILPLILTFLITTIVSSSFIFFAIFELTDNLKESTFYTMVSTFIFFFILGFIFKYELGEMSKENKEKEEQNRLIELKKKEKKDFDFITSNNFELDFIIED